MDRPILGTDFFSKHGLAIDLSGRRLLRLPQDGSSFLSPLSTVAATPSSTTLGVQGLHQPRRRLVDKLLDEFPSILVSKYDPNAPPAHGITHTVPTTGPLVFAKARRLMARPIRNVFSRTNRDQKMAILHSRIIKVIFGK